MKHAALILLAASFWVGCDREGYKKTDYSKPINEETINSTNGLTPNPRFDTLEDRPPSETPGVTGRTSKDNIQSAAESEQKSPGVKKANE